MPAEEVSLVSANLAAVCIESFLYGIFFVLSMSSVFLLIVRHRSQYTQYPAKSRRSILTSPIFVGTILLFITVTTHWIITFLRLFQAFLLYERGTSPLSFYGDLSQATEVVKTGFVMATISISDAMLVCQTDGICVTFTEFPTQIYRLWLIWNHKLSVIILPLFTLMGLTVCGVGATYQLTLYHIEKKLYMSQAGRWVTSDCVFTLCTNIYTMIAWKVWRTNKASRTHGYTQGSLLPILATLVESAALYTLWSIFFFATYQSHTNLHSTILDTWSPVAGIAYTLINVRVGLGHTQSSKQISFASQEPAIIRGQVGGNSYSMRPIAVNITRMDNGGELDMGRFSAEYGQDKVGIREPV
ncbi:hypothetical protein SERLA73DRAFT_79886 [Serpula lacrymans var. lacrymans S7.3]|uniref:Uncharacterized protein n=2 Tax=Serpula lacrymans var. lacrymans TaxID=341189 RepID=F8QHY1_SERL3|nr:uncharacterized protein SERLADRAFT_441969 [Serpula lacrymans var. lacrymans S7.9]EGN92090.1 hypothetical protein SERLA73DRAFT_79886 [Serpula lacrymans var. lacrymans S7.3]EGO20620.1 hypothetical protein SERLADRAFT_441969 [Serpula lacrymans var. lacrymans S7.9]